jgi:probable phosphoglycerate mutase
MTHAPVNAELFLVRHGETEWNTQNRMQGHLDSELTERGRTQARRNGERLRTLLDGRPFRMVASPLGRCRTTANLIADELGIESSRIAYDDRLKEHGYGEWEGKTHAHARVADAERYAAREADRWNVHAPGGESYASVASRLSAWLAEIQAEETILIVSHGCAGRILRAIYAGLETHEIDSLPQAHDHIYHLTQRRVTTLER